MMSRVFSLLVLGLFSVSIGGCKRSQSGANANLVEFSYNSGAEPETLDPHKISTLDAAQHVTSLFLPLVTKDATGLVIKPGLAESWTHNDARTEFTFTLRANAKWSNGEPVTAEQVRASMVRALNPRVACPYVQYFHDFFLGATELIKGYESPNRAQLEASFGVKVIEPNQVQFKLKQPVPLLLEYLTGQAFFIVHPSMYDPDSAAWRTPKDYISNGPFVLKEWKVNDRLVVEKNPHFYDAENVNLDRIVSFAVGDRQTVFNMYEQGKLDWTGDLQIPDTLVPKLSNRKDFYRFPMFGTYMYMFNTKRKPLDDVRVRRALSLSIDRETISYQVVRDRKYPTHFYVPPVKDYVRPEIGSTDLGENIKEAKKLLAEAGFPEGKGFPKITILYNTQEAHHRIAQSVQQMWLRNLGIKVDIENREWKVFISETQAKKFDIARRGWIGDLPDPASFMEAYLSNSDNNEPQYNNPEYDRLVRLSSQEVDPKKRYEYARQAEAILLKDAPVAPIYHYVGYGLISPEVEGFVPNMGSVYLMRYFSKKT